MVTVFTCVYCPLRLSVCLTIDVNHLLLTMDGIDNNMLRHDSRQITVRGSPSLVRGTRGSGLRLNGARQYLDAGQAPMCQGYLNKCTRGFTLRFQVHPNQLTNNMYFMSSAPYDVFYKDGRVYADFRTEKDRWIVSSADIDPSSWNLIEVSWDAVEGLTMYMNRQKVASQRTPVPNTDDYDSERHLYVGRANTNMRTEKYLDGVVDDVELWEARRSYLIGLDLIAGGEFSKHTSLWTQSLILCDGCIHAPNPNQITEYQNLCYAIAIFF